MVSAFSSSSPCSRCWLAWTLHSICGHAWKSTPTLMTTRRKAVFKPSTFFWGSTCSSSGRSSTSILQFLIHAPLSTTASSSSLLLNSRHQTQPAGVSAESDNSLNRTTTADDGAAENRHHLIFHTTRTSPADPEQAKKKEAREKRKKMIGLAKAVDRGQYAVTYQPGGPDGRSFQARSGLPNRRQYFTVLGLESSCDDTGAAVVRSDGQILGEALASQNDIHEGWGGVVPGLARDAHEREIERVIQQALARAGLHSVSQVDAIGVTVGPGLEICLRVGCLKARELAMTYQKPFVGVHHLEAHILMARLPYDTNASSLVKVPATSETHETYRAMDFPFLALLVSGGHCQLLTCYGIGNYTILGGTMDDSLGEAFDKTARLLGLPVGGGGGPAVERLAREGNPQAFAFSVPLQNRKDLDFSYSGLKTNVRRTAEMLVAERAVESVEQLSLEDRANMAASFQHVAIKHVEQRLQRAMDLVEVTGIRTLAVVGGVAANQELRSRIQALCNSRSVPWSLLVPPPRLCTDQGSMSAWAAIERLMLGSSDDPTTQEVYARFPFAVINETSSLKGNIDLIRKDNQESN